MKKLKFGTFLFVIVLFINCLNAQTISVSGNISSNTLWNADTVKIIGNVTVENGVTLTVEAGTYVEALGYYKIEIAGKIKAVGNQNDTIVFTNRDTTNFWSDTTSVAGGWGGFVFHNQATTADTSVFDYCKIQFGKKYNFTNENTLGGVIYISSYNAVVVTNSLITCNMVAATTDIENCRGGAIYGELVNYLQFTNNKFLKNRSFLYGGALSLGDDCVKAVVMNNLFQNNVAINYDGILGGFGIGGAIHCSDAYIESPEIAYNYFFNNLSDNGIIYTSNVNSLIYNNVICNNRGIGIQDGHQLSTGRIFNNTIVNNFSEFGGIWTYSSAKIYNNIVWGNRDDYFEQSVQIQNNNMGGSELFYNCIQYGILENNSINVYPEFVNPTLGYGTDYNGYEADWSLLNTSPCINSGTPDISGLSIPQFDIVGNERIVGIIDLGAYEKQTGTSIENDEFLDSEITIFPNPGSESFTLKTTNECTLIELFDINGKLVVSQPVYDFSNTVDTKFLARGIYFYKIYDTQNKIFASGKWVKL